MVDLDLARLQQWIGNTDTAEDVITPELVRRFWATLDLPQSDCAVGALAPRLIHFCLAPPVTSSCQLATDGHIPRGGFLPPVPLPRRMWAGGALTFIDDLRIGEVVHRKSQIQSVDLKQGSSGALCFVTVVHNVEVEGMRRVEERQDIVYSAASVKASKPASGSPVGETQQPISVMPPVLFRYSALTFNGHRIHYDRRYAMEEEHYPGLVVHAPLQATHLLHYAAKLRGRAPDKFIFRSQAPLFDEDVVSLHSTAEEGGLVLWTARDGGPVAMRAEAQWI